MPVEHCFIADQSHRLNMNSLTDIYVERDLSWSDIASIAARSIKPTNHSYEIVLQKTTSE